MKKGSANNEKNDQAQIRKNILPTNNKLKKKNGKGIF